MFSNVSAANVDQCNHLAGCGCSM